MLRTRYPRLFIEDHGGDAGTQARVLCSQASCPARNTGDGADGTAQEAQTAMTASK